MSEQSGIPTSNTTVFLDNVPPIWGDDAQEQWERMRTGPAVDRRKGMSMLVSPSAIDELMHNPALLSSNPDAVYLGSDTGLIPLQVDPPDHIRYRRMLDPLFSPPKMAKLEADVADLADRCIDDFIEQGSCDVASQFSVPIPSGTFLHLLGLPIERLDEFIAFKDDMIRPRGSTRDEVQATLKRAGEWVFNLFNEALGLRAGQQTDDILGHLFRLESTGELTRPESLNVCHLLLSAGLDTVTDSLECSFVFLARNPSHQRLLVEDPALTPKAVEELLRWMCPVPTVARVMMDDADVEGCPVRSGTRVSVMLATINIDPSRFEDPSEVDFARKANKHASFGLGVHRCLGSHLARMELRVALTQWHRRIPSYRLPAGFVPEYAPSLREIPHLPLEFEPGSRLG